MLREWSFSDRNLSSSSPSKQYHVLLLSPLRTVESTLSLLQPKGINKGTSLELPYRSYSCWATSSIYFCLTAMTLKEITMTTTYSCLKTEWTLEIQDESLFSSEDMSMEETGCCPAPARPPHHICQSLHFQSSRAAFPPRVSPPSLPVCASGRHLSVDLLLRGNQHTQACSPPAPYRTLPAVFTAQLCIWWLPVRCWSHPSLWAPVTLTHCPVHNSAPVRQYAPINDHSVDKSKSPIITIHQGLKHHANTENSPSTQTTGACCEAVRLFHKCIHIPLFCLVPSPDSHFPAFCWLNAQRQ